ncbi:hypothetical protein RVR_P235 (plasmid) [Actinacidiphila reveromycinica]|uniref:Uncharacterized protein n=1 Tax=Actinacidiphila reveromycinica TaxID=659352 RepID=A0A7R6QDZ6_9ACTN|nr:hypothetical protein [Streptomyces sp. SN-593]BBG20776.1 hypothetical protein RVR_P235 [Streptomyces sp. SN-593]
MSTVGTNHDSAAPARRDRARPFVPELIPEPQDLDRTGPLDAREQRDLERVHAARDHHQAAKWMRGKALESAFRRKLYRGEDGQRTRQQYLDDEWDGISESAAYREISEWPLAKEISDVWERPAPDSHIRALLGAAESRGHELVAHWYAELCRHGRQAALRVTADVVTNLGDYLRSGADPQLETLFVPRQLPPGEASTPDDVPPRSTKAPVTGTVRQQPSFPNLGTTDDDIDAGPAEEPEELVLSASQVDRLSTWLTAEARSVGISPAHAADLLVDALTGRPLKDWITANIQM